jgi:hypothetical protein
MRAVAILASVAMLAGCFGYSSSAKKWAYLGDSILIAGGGATIAGDIATRPHSCEGGLAAGCPVYTPPFDGALVAGIVLVTAGLVGILLNATRTELKTSR